MSMSNYQVQRVNYLTQDVYKNDMRLWLQDYEMSQGRALRYFIQTFGCQQNEADSEKIRGILADLGLAQGQGYEDADLVLINTCSIRENADQRLFGHLGELKALRSKRPSLKVVVCGCLPTQAEQNAKIRESFAFVNLLMGPQDIQRLPELLLAILRDEKKVNAVSKSNVVAEGLPIVRERKFRALVSIMYGCNNFCSYCMVPSARERERSRLAKDILAECREVAAEGIPEVMLLGQNVNAWGFDLQTAAPRGLSPLSYSDQEVQKLEALRAGKLGADAVESFPQLLAAISSIPEIQSIRFMSPHPRDFGGEMLAALKVVPEIANHVHLPVQSGSDQVLLAMNRHYDRQRYLDLVQAIRAVRPGISITTDIMVGFPGESDEDFEDTLDLVKQAQFSSAFSFIYSPRPGTRAASWPQLDSDLKHQRFDRLLDLLNSLSLAEHQAMLGTERRVLLEGISKGDSMVLTGRDSEFHLININIPPDLVLPAEAYACAGQLSQDYFEGRFVQVRISLAKTFSLEADLLA